MRGLVLSRFNIPLLCYAKQSFRTNLWLVRCSMQNRNISNFTRNIGISECPGRINNDLSLDAHYPHCTPKSAKQFSTTKALTKSKDRGKDKKKHHSDHVDLKELGQVLNVEKLLSDYERTVENLKDQFIKYTSVRSTIGAVESLPIKFEGHDYTLQELAQINRKSNMLILNVSAFPQTIPNILESISKTKMNLNPQQDGTMLYVPIPKVTKEYRENLSKHAKSLFNKCRENITDVRNRHIKVVKKDTGISSELAYRVEGYISALSHQYVNKAEKLLETKQKELLGD